VDRDIPRQLDVVLQPGADQVLPVVALEIGAGLGDFELLRDAAQEIRDAAEAQTPAAAAVGHAVVAEVLPIDAGLHRLTAAYVEDLIGQLIQVLTELLRIGPIGADVSQAGDVQLATSLARHELEIVAAVHGINVLERMRAVEAAAQLV